MKRSRLSKTIAIISWIITGVLILAMFNMDGVIACERKISLSLAKRKVEREFQKYREVIPEKMPELCTDLPVEGKITVKTDACISRIVDYTSHYYIYYDLKQEITLETESSLDDLSSVQIYETLQTFFKSAREANSKTVDTYLPDYKELIYSDKVREYVYLSPDDSFQNLCIIKTPGHEYQYGPQMKYESNHRESYYLADGNRRVVPHKPSSSYTSRSSNDTNPNLESTGYNDGEHCIVILCNNRQQKGYLFCEKHKCCVHGCPRQRNKNDIYCQSHIDEFKKNNHGKTYGSGTGYEGSSSNHYNTNSYSNAEDFADEWAGEFDDYDEAYEYYEEVTGHY